MGIQERRAERPPPHPPGCRRLEAGAIEWSKAAKAVVDADLGEAGHGHDVPFALKLWMTIQCPVAVSFRLAQVSPPSAIQYVEVGTIGCAVDNSGNK